MTAIIVRMETFRAGRQLAQRASDLNSIGRRLEASREAQGLRLTDLADQSGVAKNTLSNWEAGTKRPSLDQVALVLPILRVTLDWVYFGDDGALDWQVREAIVNQLAQMPEPPPRSPLRKLSGD
ncbi:HTH_XRE domain containing protein [uncultured Caudovirales phage]|uniref:HTH_XRE domain containing protein n=1 Tax=uncultured Caudovirales phage TaxID=2100421 RepID=A0A6J5L3X0_9CAUD|nr:HTH_XRE domain containing protein [uncultured Caudovirales phage]